MATEMKSTQTHQVDTPQGAAELDPESLSAIRSLIQTEAAAPAKAASERTAMGQTSVEPAPQQHAEAPPRPLRARDSFDEVRPQATLPQHSGGFVGRIKASVFGYRPTLKHILLAAAALLVLFRPGLVVGAILLVLVAFVCIFLILGYDGFWQRAIGLVRWYAARRPSKAKEMHRKLDAFALKWDNFLDRFPEGTVDGLYLPDLEELARADARHDEALDRRLSGLREGDA